MTLQLFKISRSGRLLETHEFENLQEISEFLKQPIEIINQIKAGFIFPRGKLCILNKFSIKPKTIKPQEKFGILEFN